MTSPTNIEDVNKRGSMGSGSPDAMPTSVGVATHHADDAEQFRRLGARGAIGESAKLMRHRDEQAVDIGSSRQAADDDLQRADWGLHGHAGAVVAPPLETAC